MRCWRKRLPTPSGKTQATPQRPTTRCGPAPAVYLEALALPGRARLLLIDAPAVLGRAEPDRPDTQTGRATLREGLQSALGRKSGDDGTLDALVELLSAAFDRAALAQLDGKPGASLRAALELLLRGLLAHAPRPGR